MSVGKTQYQEMFTQNPTVMVFVVAAILWPLTSYLNEFSTGNTFRNKKEL
jgi:hypothetical protein